MQQGNKFLAENQNLCVNRIHGKGLPLLQSYCPLTCRCHALSFIWQFKWMDLDLNTRGLNFSQFWEETHILWSHHTQATHGKRIKVCSDIGNGRELHTRKQVISLLLTDTNVGFSQGVKEWRLENWTLHLADHHIFEYVQRQVWCLVWGPLRYHAYLGRG